MTGHFISLLQPPLVCNPSVPIDCPFPDQLGNVHRHPDTYHPVVDSRREYGWHSVWKAYRKGSKQARKYLRDWMAIENCDAWAGITIEAGIPSWEQYHT